MRAVVNSLTSFFKLAVLNNLDPAFSAFVEQFLTPDETFLTFVVDRTNIVDSTYQQVLNTSASDIGKPLRVVFTNEEAEDRGGVRKEFFMLLFQELLHPKYVLFCY